ncbi:alpha/beta fold hydrolase [Aquimarina intermedia]|uniref:Tricorn interacting aminopeptidase F1 n=1 Tax=Aquimarina intermedia TaxID=350814 RepID=A0A5S5CF23_9FLAO|nr:alpha/beta fold hydrolase [Aquimarina intermedia]TYP77102.1 tricorn interacting aminopeptidase F1 [Aquimarina intermedia]
MKNTKHIIWGLVGLVFGMHAQQKIHDDFEPQLFTINGYNINIETRGSGGPIVFIAGGPGDSHDYLQGNFGSYYKSNQVVFFDGLGRGLSDDAKDAKEYSVANDVEILEEIRKVLDLEQWSVVGHSYGTIVAQAYAIKYPKKVSKMILISGFHSGLMWQANCDSYNQYAKTHFPQKWKTIDSLRKKGFISRDSLFSKVYGSLPVKYVYYHNTKLKQPMPKKVKRSWNAEVYYGIVGDDADFHVTGSMGAIDFRKQLSQIKTPTLVVAGRYDGVSTPEFAMQYKHYMPQAEFVMFENSGHNPYLEEPEKFFKLFDEFLEIKEKDK